MVIDRSQFTDAGWSGRRVLVTGATGLLGAALVDELHQVGASVVAVVRDHVPSAAVWSTGASAAMDVVSGDICDGDLMLRALNEYEVDVVFHLAAQTFESNIRGTYMLLDACRAYGKTSAIIVASSDKAYGDHDELPYREDAPLIGRHPYDVSKSCADLISTSYHRTFGLPINITRCGNLYGPGDLNYNRIVPGTIRSILNGEAPIIRSDGKMIRDYFYVRDGALAYLQLASHTLTTGLAGEAFNFSNEIQLTVLDIVQAILRAMDSDLEPVVLGTASGEIVHQYLSAAKARSDLGWSPQFDLDSGLRETIDWYSERHSARIDR
jgi:CDP-glucose 4,6-dehydratase